MRARTILLLALTMSLATLCFYKYRSGRLSYYGHVIAALTRPWWDTPHNPTAIITHYHSNSMTTMNASVLCGLHGWVPGAAAPGRRVVDSVIFSTELDILEIRIRELWDVVDVFAVLEADRTFTGHKKPLVLHNNINRFKFAIDAKKLVVGVTKDLTELEPGVSPFKNEGKMRSIMGDFLVNIVKIQPDDLLITTDCDEIPYRHTIQLLKTCQGWPAKLNLMMQSYSYSFEFKEPYDYQWAGAVRRYVNGTDPYCRYGCQSEITALSDAGWHCSYCFRFLEEFRTKMVSFSHADRANQENVKLENIQKAICAGVDVFGRIAESYNVRDMVARMKPEKSIEMTNLPAYVLENPQKFAFLLPGGCTREKGNYT
eukprot:TRINITY_DN15324_c0_g1_i1.p1 TRINITY_DN15324_c0_g1~~TRINITY_DN15324_c0_g1_i1.p1  ORF type:complete len:371 (-),score=21.06 TRINITY_DN15324_c0_g1_i1:13-1125(-)